MATELYDELGQMLGDRYTVERELGGGGMSRVFLATERSLERRVVIKVLPPALTSGVNAARFQREILVTAGLQHPHILPILAAGSGNGLLYYVTPYIEGQSLRERLTLEGALPVDEAARILREVAGALAQAHARGVVHRDVKPENILLSAGHAVLADFGIARALALRSQGDRLTEAGLGIGTPGYMAPEQVAGDPTVDARADVFALGVIGYEMLAGRPPFPDPVPNALVNAYFAEAPPSLEAVRPETPVAVARAITRALARTPEQRFATAGEFCDALTPSTHGSSVVARRRRRRLRMMITAGTLVVGTLAGFGLAAAIARRWGGREDDAGARKTLAVLPFKNLGRAEDAYFADGITEELTSRLASLSGLGVISRTSADQYRTSKKTLRQIAGELGAAYVLEGSVRWDRTPDGHGRVRVTPQLIRMRDDSHMWAERYDAELSDVFAVQSQIADRVARALAVALASGERRQMDARPTENLTAYDSYIRGEQLRTHESTNPNALARAAGLLAEAGASDPRFALAFAKLSLADQELYDRFVDRSPGRLTSARVAADSALALAPSLPEAHLALGRHFESVGEMDRAGREYAVAERGRPNDSGILGRTAAVLARRGRWTEAVARLRRAAELDPRSTEANLSAAEGSMLVRDQRAATEYVVRALAIDSNDIAPYVMKARLQFGLAGDRAAGRRTAHEILQRFGAERAAVADGFDGFASVLDTTDLQTLARLSPSAWGGNRLLYLYWRVALFELWRPDLAKAHADSLVTMGDSLLRATPDDVRLHCALGWLHAIRGQRADAQREVRLALTLMPRSRDGVAWLDAAEMAARTYVHAGDLDAAVDQLELLLRTPSMLSIPQLRTDPHWDPLRGHPRFRQLVASGA
jgi:serine/threonine-protein kinase